MNLRHNTYEKTLQYFNGDTLATDVWINKYCLKDNQQHFYEETPNDMHRRLAKELARIEDQYTGQIKLDEEEIFQLLKDFKYIIPQGSPMAGIGNSLQTISLGNCFVIGNEYDSYGGIMHLEEEMVHLMKRRGGVGLDLSHIRPKGSPVHNAAITSTGVVPFMERFSNGTREVAQDGRRGALMQTISILHPDVEHFIDAKLELNRVTGANISVKITDEFMQCVKEGQLFEQQFPIDSQSPYVKKTIDAKKLWKKMMHNAWKSAEPGILFWSRIIEESPADCYTDEGFKTISTNPCLTGDTKVQIKQHGLFTEVTIQKLYQLFSEQKAPFIISYNLETNKNEVDVLVNVMLTKPNAEIIQLNFSNQHSLKVTPDHQIFTINRGWIEAQDLSTEDRLINFGFGTNYEIRLVGKESLPNEDVYDLTIKHNHNFFANGILVKNCGELPISAYESCRLLCINLYSYVRQPFTKNAFFDFELFSKHVQYAQQLMDDIVDLEKEKIEAILRKIIDDPEEDFIKATEYGLWDNIKESLLKGRRTGLGITAEGDMLAALQLRYGTPEATAMAIHVHQHLAKNALIASIHMAKDRGHFPIWSKEKEKENPFLNRVFKLLDKNILDMYDEYGRRNIAMLTVAPTGCLHLDSIIKTENGNISLKDLFLFYGYNVSDFNGLKNIWLEIDKNIFVSNIQGKKNKITKLYWNGWSETKKLIFKDGSCVESTNEHKFLVKINDLEACWKQAFELKPGDKLITLK